LSPIRLLSALPTTVPSPLLFFVTAPPPTEISTLSLHDALPILGLHADHTPGVVAALERYSEPVHRRGADLHHFPLRQQLREPLRSEEHTSELQSHLNLVCRLLLEKKKQKKDTDDIYHKTRDQEH